MSNEHTILMPYDAIPVASCPEYARYVVGQAKVFCGDRIYAAGMTTSESKKLANVVGRVFQPDEPIPTKLPAVPSEHYVRARLNHTRDYYEFTLYPDPNPNATKPIDARVGGAKKGELNVLVTWARFKGSLKWVRCSREREFEGT